MRSCRSLLATAHIRRAMLLTLAGTVLVLTFIRILSVNAATESRVPGLCNCGAPPVKGKYLTRLLEGLRLKTGWRDLIFDDRGYLQLGERLQPDGGSAVARELILAALGSRDTFELRMSNHDSSVAFAQIEPVHVRFDAQGRRSDGWTITLDFNDFSELRGGAEAIAAFDPAINVLHELAHAVLGLRDNFDDADVLGDCERYTNRIRSDLRLPERFRYLPENSRKVLPGSTATVVLAELTFVHSFQREAEIREKRQPLFFSVENVGISAAVAPIRSSRVMAMHLKK